MLSRQPKVTRRQFIQTAIATGLGSAVPQPSSATNSATGSWQLEAVEISRRFEPQQPAPAKLLGFNGSTPGPVLRIPQNRVSEINVINSLPEPTAVHWHGLRIDNAMDGVPGMTQDAIAPGGSFRYLLNPPDAGTYWYHSHHRSWQQLARGLAGILIVEEPQAQGFDLDLVFAVDDWRLDDDLQLDEKSFGSLHDWAHGGRLGNYLTVNGQTLPEFQVISGQRIRLRVVNIANARVMTLRFPQGPIWEIAKDGQPVSPRLIEDQTVTLAPAQRIDLVLDLTADPGSLNSVEVLVRDQVLEVADFRYHQSERQAVQGDEPLPLPANPLHLVELAARQDYLTVPMKLEGGAMGRMSEAIYQGETLGVRELARQGQVWAINGFAGMTEQPLFRVQRGTPISIEINNNNAWPHGIHVHGHHFQDGREPGVWRDTALLNRGEKTSLRFVADNPGQWLIHCHMVEHQVAGMKTWFEVT